MLDLNDLTDRINVTSIVCQTFVNNSIVVKIGPFEFKVEGRSKTAGTAEGCDFWDQNGVLLLHLRVQQQRKSKINELTMSDGIE